jgi:hypothetical protein
MRKFRRGYFLAIVLAVGLVVGALSVYFNDPNRHPVTGFGPEWKCWGASAKGAGFCIKKSVLDPANPATPSN